MPTALRVFAVCLLLTPGWAAPPPSLDQLFTSLKQAPSLEAAMPLERAILARFALSGSAAIDLMMERAEIAQKAGDKATAGKLLQMVTEIAPAFAEGWRVRAAWLNDAGDDSGAVAALHRAVALNPRHFLALVELGDLLEQYGDQDGALKFYRNARAVDPQMEGLQRKVDALSRSVEGQGI